MDKKSWMEFTNDTTLHGIKYVFRSSFGFRKLLWLCCVMTSAGLFMYQVITRSRDFFRYESAVNVAVLYQGELVFPAVTLCNQNTYRLTASVNANVYDFLDSYYSNGSTSELNTANMDNVNMTTLHRTLGHQIEDFIYSCEWLGEPCNMDVDFETRLTDFGLCYTFNGRKTPMPHTVAVPGSSNGLSLTINIEQYEYMRGPQNDAGIKMALHEQDEEPKVKDLGFSVPPGMNTLVGVKKIQILNLDTPYGNCSEVIDYRYSHCSLACKTRTTIELCGCRDVYMPNVSQDDKLCNASKLFGCVKQKKRIISRTEDCGCRVACNRTLYESNLSYGKISSFNAERMLSSNKLNKLENVRSEFKNAKEVAEISVDENRNTNRKLTKKYLKYYKNLLTITETLAQKLINVELKDSANLTYKETDSIGNLSIIMQDDATDSFTKFDSFYQTTTARTVKNTLGYLESKLYIQLDMMEGNLRVRKLIQHAHVSRTPFGDIIHPNLIELLTKCMNESLNYTECKNQIDNSNFWSFYDRLFREAQSKRVNMVFQQIDQLLQLLSNKMNPKRSDLHTLLSNCTAKIKESQNLSSIIQDILEPYSVQNISEKIKTLEKALYIEDLIRERVRYIKKQGYCGWFAESFRKAKIKLGKLATPIDEAVKSVQHAVRKLNAGTVQSVNVSLYIDTLEQYLEGDAKKEDVAALFTTKHYDKTFNSIIFSAENILKDIDQINSAVNQLQVVLNTHWGLLADFDFIFFENGIQDTKLYNHLNIDTSLNDNMTHPDLLVKFPENVLKNYSRTLMKQRHELKQALETYALSSDGLMEDLSDFKQSIQVNEKFVMNNFMQIDVFYKELSYEKIEQQVAFEFLSLLSEVGGFLGLLLGASVLTVCELVDFLIVTACSKGKQKDEADQEKGNKETQKKYEAKEEEGNQTRAIYNN